MARTRYLLVLPEGGRPDPDALRMEDQRQILSYALHTELGHDRLGRVFRAVDTRNLKPVILRLLRVGGLVPTQREEAVRVQVRRLMRAAANVAHPNIAPIVDIASYRDLELVAWEDFGGVPLAERLAEGAPAVEALRWAVEAASAIARAHSRDVPHGRISLANIMVARDEGVRVLDLGMPRPKAIPFLVEDEADATGTLRPAPRNLPRLMRQDVAELAGVVQEIVTLAPPHMPDAPIRAEIGAAVAEACASVLALPRPTAAQLHLALVEVARRTPADGRRGGGLLERPVRTLPDPEPVPAPAVVPEANAATVARAGDPLPFALSDYENTRAGGLKRTEPPAAPPLRVWGAAAFELEAEEADDEEVVAAFDPHEPPLMTRVLLPPMTPGERPAEEQPDERPRFRLWPQFVIAAIIGVLLAVGLFALEQALRGRGAGTAMPAPAARDAPGLPGPPAGTAPAALSPAPRPVAGRGQPAGTLVITVTQPDVTVSVDGSRPEAAPVTWDDLPAGRRIVRVMAPGFTERVDTVDVRPNLTTTRYYILAPAR